MTKDPNKTPCLYTAEDGAVRCFEYLRHCSSCEAVHGCSQAWQGQVMGQGEARHYPLDKIEVLRVTNITYFAVEVVLQAMFLLTGAHVTAHSAARLMRFQGRRLGEPPQPLCNPKLLRHAEIIAMVVWWHFEVEELDPCTTDLSQALGQEADLDLFVEKETLLQLRRLATDSCVIPGDEKDGGETSQGGYIGTFHKMMMKWPLVHGPCYHPDCGAFLIMDGNQDVVAKMKAKKKTKQYKEARRPWRPLRNRWRKIDPEMQFATRVCRLLARAQSRRRAKMKNSRLRN